MHNTRLDPLRRRFTVDLRLASSFSDVVSSFNTGLIELGGGKWKGKSWNAFHDYLTLPNEESYTLEILGWKDCVGLTDDAREMMLSVFKDNPHVTVEFV